MILNEKILREPYFEIWIDGKPLDPEINELVEEVIYEDHATGSDICSVTINDPEMKLISDPLFASETPFKLIGGYRLLRRVMLEGFISAVDYEFTEDGIPRLTIHAMDKSHIMDRVLRSRTFKKMSRYSVVQAIAKEYKFKFSGNPNKKALEVEESIAQSNETDIQFLMNIANECDMIVYIKGDTLYFHERNFTTTPQATLTYRNYPFNLISFTPRLVQKEIPIVEQKQDVEKKTGKVTKSTATESTPRKHTSKTPATNLRNTKSSSGSNSGSSSRRIVYENGQLKVK